MQENDCISSGQFGKHVMMGRYIISCHFDPGEKTYNGALCVATETTDQIHRLSERQPPKDCYRALLIKQQVNSAAVLVISVLELFSVEPLCKRYKSFPHL